jgi:hypothetical protein
MHELVHVVTRQLEAARELHHWRDGAPLVCIVRSRALGVVISMPGSLDLIEFPSCVHLWFLRSFLEFVPQTHIYVISGNRLRAITAFSRFSSLEYAARPDFFNSWSCVE